MSSSTRFLLLAERAYLNQTHVSNKPFTQSYRYYATQGANSKPSRRSITVTSDDGRYHWSELSTGEKAARSTQQSFNFLLVSAGAVATLCVTYLLYTELFAADSKTRQFNRAVERVKDDPACRAILGPANQIKAYGEPTTSKWARARPLAHSIDVDKFGTTHFRMHFHVEGPDAAGVAPELGGPGARNHISREYRREISEKNDWEDVWSSMEIEHKGQNQILYGLYPAGAPKCQDLKNWESTQLRTTVLTTAA